MCEACSNGATSKLTRLITEARVERPAEVEALELAVLQQQQEDRRRSTGTGSERLRPGAFPEGKLPSGVVSIFIFSPLIYLTS